MRAFTFAAALGVLLAIAPRTFAAEAQTYLLLDYATPAAGQDAAYAAWLDDQRVPNMLRAAGMVNAQLFILADVQNRPRQAGVAANIPQPAKYLTVYTLNTRDIAAALDSMRARYKPSGDAPKLSASYNYVFRAITPIVQAKSPANPETGAQNDYELLVFANTKPGRDDDFNKEYNEDHAPGVAVSRGFVNWRRFVLNAEQLDDTPTNKYLALYGIRTANLASVYDDMRKRRMDTPKEQLAAAAAAREKSAYEYTTDYSESYKLTGVMRAPASSQRK